MRRSPRLKSRGWLAGTGRSDGGGGGLGDCGKHSAVPMVTC